MNLIRCHLPVSFNNNEARATVSTPGKSEKIASNSATISGVISSVPLASIVTSCSSIDLGRIDFSRMPRRRVGINTPVAYWASQYSIAVFDWVAITKYSLPPTDASTDYVKYASKWRVLCFIHLSLHESHYGFALMCSPPMPFPGVESPSCSPTDHLFLLRRSSIKIRHKRVDRNPVKEKPWRRERIHGNNKFISVPVAPNGKFGGIVALLDKGFRFALDVLGAATKGIVNHLINTSHLSLTFPHRSRAPAVSGGLYGDGCQPIIAAMLRGSRGISGRS